MYINIFLEETSDIIKIYISIKIRKFLQAWKQVLN